MRRLSGLFLLVVLATFCASPVVAGAFTPKTEWSFSGTYLHEKDGPVSWEAGSDLLFPVAGKGVLLLGPNFVINKDSGQTRLGPVIEFNVPGGQKGGFFFGASWDYFVKNTDGLDRSTTAGRAGVKLPIAKSGLVKMYLEKAVSGRGKEQADLNGVIALAVKF